MSGRYKDPERCRTMAEWRAANERWKGGLRIPAEKPVYDPDPCPVCGGMVFEPGMLPAFIPIPDGVCRCGFLPTNQPEDPYA